MRVENPVFIACKELKQPETFVFVLFGLVSDVQSLALMPIRQFYRVK